MNLELSARIITLNRFMHSLTLLVVAAKLILFNEKGEIRENVEIINPIIAGRGFGLPDKIK